MKVIICTLIDHSRECVIWIPLLTGHAEFQGEAHRARDHQFLVRANNADRDPAGRRGNHALIRRVLLLAILSFSSFGLPIIKLPGGIQTNFIPMLFVKCFGGSFSSGRLRSGTRLPGKSPARVANVATRTSEKRCFMGKPPSDRPTPKNPYSNPRFARIKKEKYKEQRVKE